MIPALVGRGDAVVSDELSHASIIDGCRLSRADVHVFPHGDLAAVERVLADTARRHRRVLLAIDGVYSMDGDVAPVAELVAAAKRHGAIVLLDDAHGTGTLGALGRGSAELCGVTAGVDVLLGTLGKGLGSYGAFVVGTRALRELLVNVARPFIFSCALAPPQVAAAIAALELVRREPWRRERLQANAQRLRARLAAHGIDTRPSTYPHRAGRDRRQLASHGRMRGFCSSAASTRRGSATRPCPRARRGCASRRWPRTARTRSTRSRTPWPTRWRARR